MKEKIRQFMIGRYGTDGLNQFLNIASLVLVLAYILTRLPLLLYVGVVLLGFCYYRMFSRNISKRTEENYRYYAMKDRIRSKFSSLRLFRCRCRAPFPCVKLRNPYILPFFFGL